MEQNIKLDGRGRLWSLSIGQTTPGTSSLVSFDEDDMFLFPYGIYYSLGLALVPKKTTFLYRYSFDQIVERGDGSYDSTSLFLYIRQLL